jgi:tetratricopeptide (TPR) repeat protein
MERGLVLRQHFFGAESDEVWNACKTVGEMCNLLAMTYLQQEDFNMVLELLKKAEILTERDLPGRAATYNNLACYYRRQGKLHSALQYLQKALKIESKLSNVQNAADTHINACAVLSQLGRHQSALEHAQNALILLQEELLSPPGSDHAAPPQADRIAVLAIAYHNIGVEQEFLKRYEQSMLSYRKGVEVAERYLGPKHAICITLRNSLLAAKKAAMKEEMKSGGAKTSAGGGPAGSKTAGALMKSQRAPAKGMVGGAADQKMSAKFSGEGEDLDDAQQRHRDTSPSRSAKK